jgi:hypothetical protein
MNHSAEERSAPTRPTSRRRSDGQTVQRLSAGPAGLAAPALAVRGLIGGTGGTLYQKRFCADANLWTATVIQYAAATMPVILLAAEFETMNIMWSFSLHRCTGLACPGAVRWCDLSALSADPARRSLEARELFLPGPADDGADRLGDVWRASGSAGSSGNGGCGTRCSPGAKRMRSIGNRYRFNHLCHGRTVA